MTDDFNEFFEQLLRAEQRRSNTSRALLHRIPDEPAGAARQVKRLVDHAVNEITDVMQTVGNIMRWNGSEGIRGELSEDYLELLRKLRAMAADEPDEEC